MDVSRAPHYLLVDDHSLIREGMMQAIRSLDPAARFSHANTLQGALSKLVDAGIDDPIDVVLLDLGLPDSRGMATLQSVRAAAPTQRIGIITGQSDVQIALEWILKGCTNHAIATALGISAETVKLHVSAIFRAYGVHSRTQLVLLCSRSPAAISAGEDDEVQHASPLSEAFRESAA